MGFPQVVILAGPNGAGKTTTAPHLLRYELKVAEYVNADIIAQGLSGFRQEGSGIEAGRIMLQRLEHLAGRGESFAFESTLASRALAGMLRRWKREGGYTIHIAFLWLDSPLLAMDRVRERVLLGGHGVPEATIRRRYTAGLRNFFQVYMPMADSWFFYDNSSPGGPASVASREAGDVMKIFQADLWNQLVAANG